MSTESAFNKRLRPESTFNKIEAVLEHLNLPPQFIEFVRKNRKMVVFIVVILITTIVAASLYTSYREQQITKAASALSFASEKTGEEKIAALEKVAAEFSSTSSALWAKIEIAQEQVKNEKYTRAAEQYAAILQEINKKNPVYPLLLFGRAGALENAQSWEAAIAEYTTLQEVVGYEALGYLGVGRIYQQQGDMKKALAVYNNFLLKAGDDSRMQADKQNFSAQIARVKTLIGDQGKE